MWPTMVTQLIGVGVMLLNDVLGRHTFLFGVTFVRH